MADDFQYIKLPDGSYGKFLSTASDADIRSAISKDFPTAFASESSTPDSTRFIPQGELGIGADTSGGVNRWLDKLENDVRYGGTSTIPGKILSMMGARGVNMGTSEGAAEKIASPVLGPIAAAKGVVEMKDRPLTGAAHAVGGALQTAELPMAFMGGPAAKQAIEAIPSKSWAAKAFQQVMGTARSAEVDPNEAGQVAMDVQKLAQSGGQMPKVVRDFLKRVTDPNQGPLTYEDARNFYSNATRISADEMNRLTPVMKRGLIQFTTALGKSIKDTANNAGVGELYSQAMSNYRGASKVEDVAKWLVTKGVPAAVAGYFAKSVYNSAAARMTR